MEEAQKILIVDDSDLIAGMLGQVLADAGYRVCRAANGVDGVIAVYREIPDLIILDVEMPLMQGYQVSRLLKKRRGVRDIPIVMHTSLSDDKDKYWALSSGADAFVNKDFDNIDQLLTTVAEWVVHPLLDRQVITDDGADMDREKVFEMLGALFDIELFQSTILNLLGDIGRSIGSLARTGEDILALLPKVCGADIGVILVPYQKVPNAFIRPVRNLFNADVDEFLEICYPDFDPLFPQLGFPDLRRTLFGVDGRDDFDKMRLDQKRISSYLHFPLIGKGETPVGSLHVGSFINNYFSDRITDNIRVFAKGAGIVVENALLFNQAREMERNIRNVFGKFVPREIIDDLVEKQSDEALLVGEKRRIVVLFSDIRSFTTITESNPAEAVVKFLNHHFTVMVDIIKQHGGSIDKFIGDAIFAIFGAPISYEDNGMRAVRAAAEMIANRCRVDTDGLILPEIGYDIGIGLHEGDAIVGNIGSSEKFDYTAIGDTVNTAARLEGLTKHYHRKILLSEDLGRQVAADFPLREADIVKVKGKTTATRIFSIDMGEDILSETARDLYEKGLKLYKLGNWETAAAYFTQVLEHHPNDWLTAQFDQRCRRYQQDPPENWDGSLALDFK
jgi:adenylate cyclase